MSPHMLSSPPALKGGECLPHFVEEEPGSVTGSVLCNCHVAPLSVTRSRVGQPLTAWSRGCWGGWGAFGGGRSSQTPLSGKSQSQWDGGGGSAWALRSLQPGAPAPWASQGPGWESCAWAGRGRGGGCSCLFAALISVPYLCLFAHREFKHGRGHRGCGEGLTMFARLLPAA